MTGIWYCTRGDVTSALDITATARRAAQVDRAIETASRSVESLTHRRFYPQVATRYKDWPNFQLARPWRLWLDADEVISITTLTASGVVITPASYNLEPVNVGPPYTMIEIVRSTSATFGSASTAQRAIVIAGVFGGCATDEVPAGNEWGIGVTSVATTMTITDSSLIDVGTALRVGTERMIVTARTMVTTSQTLQTPVTASAVDVSITVTTGASYAIGETILLDSERMLIVDIAGNALTVRRAYDGTTLAAHTGATIYAPRTLTLTRGALGTTAATISAGAALVRIAPPALIVQLTIAEAMLILGASLAGYADNADARDTGSVGKSRAKSGGIDGLREQVTSLYGRSARSRVV